MSVQPWQAPVLVVDASGKASKEWLRWLQQLLAAGATVDLNSADITQLKSLIASADTAIAALQATVAALKAASLTLETNYALNGSQTQLNLVAGANVTLADNGSGDITISTSSAAGSAAFVTFVEETPVGALNGINTALTLSFTPSPAASLNLFLNGVEQVPSTDYTVSGNALAFTIPPKASDLLIAQYTR